MCWFQLGEDIDAKSSTISRSNFSGMDSSGNQYGSNGYSLNSNSIGGYSTHGDSIGMSIPHRATPVGASDDESNSGIANGPPYSVVQMQDDSSMSMFGNRADNYQGIVSVKCMHYILVFFFKIIYYVHRWSSV